jgi:predicted transcriptional regulator
MTTTIDIPDSLYEALRKQAEKRNVSISSLVVQSIESDPEVHDRGDYVRVWVRCDSGQT